MCGHLGWFQLEESETVGYSPETFKKGLIECATRGLDAVGFYSPDIGLRKFPIGAYEFAHKEKETLEFVAMQRIVIAHCRAASHGKNVFASRDNNENNHPFEGDRFVIAHNGYFGNLPKVKGYQYKGECDSERFLSYLETFGLTTALKMQMDSDKYAVVIYDKVTNKIYWYRHNNPLVFTYDTVRKSIVWGSTSKIISEMDDEVVVNHGIKSSGQGTIWSMLEDALYTIGDDGDFTLEAKIQPCLTTELRSTQFKEEMELLEGETYNERFRREDEEEEERRKKAAPVYPIDTKIGISTKRTTLFYLHVGMYGKMTEQKLKAFSPLIYRPSQGTEDRIMVAL